MTESLPHLLPLIRPLRLSTPDIACADWDLLFRAVLERMAGLSSHPLTPARRVFDLQTEADVQRECLAALEQLRQSATVWLPAERVRLRG